MLQGSSVAQRRFMKKLSNNYYHESLSTTFSFLYRNTFAQCTQEAIQIELKMHRFIHLFITYLICISQ